MFYIQIAKKHGDKLKPPAKKVTFTSKSSEVEAINNKSSKFAKKSICNIQQLYYLERRLFC